MKRDSVEEIEYHLERGAWFSAWSVLKKLLDKGKIGKTDARRYKARIEELQKEKGWRKNGPVLKEYELVE